MIKSFIKVHQEEHLQHWHDIFLEQNGVCVGASYYKGWNVGHKIIRSLDDLPSLQSSKYVQSDTLHTYSEVRCLLSQGIKVLYSGTPCQIAGLNSFLGNVDKSNLLTIDLICHGVPSINFSKLFNGSSIDMESR